MLDGCCRIMLIGSGGAGKSTFARELAQLTHLPIVHLDQIFWKPGWEPTPSFPRDTRPKVLAALSNPRPDLRLIRITRRGQARQIFAEMRARRR
jgi:hypothetical protein